MTGITTTDLVTRDPGDAEAALRAVFPSITLGRVDRTEFRAAFSATTATGFAMLDYDIRGPGISAGGSDELVVVAGRGEGLRIRHGRSDVDVSAPFLAPEEGLAASWHRHGASALALGVADVERFAASTLGDPTFRLRRTGTAPRDPDRARYWALSVQHVRRLVANTPEAFESPMVERSVAEQLMAAFLHTFPTTWCEPVAAAPGAAGSALVRRALEVMHEHAGSPITVADVAAAVFISTRGLHYAFTRDLGETPSQALRRIRLDRAREDLLRAGPDVSVRAVASRWGFAQTARFVTAYAAVFGESPAETLRR